MLLACTALASAALDTPRTTPLPHHFQLAWNSANKTIDMDKNIVEPLLNCSVKLMNERSGAQYMEDTPTALAVEIPSVASVRHRSSDHNKSKASRNPTSFQVFSMTSFEKQSQFQ
jgi:hypothetical protein